MSNVLRRNRTISKIEYISNARIIREEMTKMVMNERIVPKKYRYVFAIPMISSCRDLTKAADKYFNCVGHSEYDEYRFKLLYERKMDALRSMLDACDDILDYFYSIQVHICIKINFRNKIIGFIVKEQELIQNAMEDEEEKYSNFINNSIAKEKQN